MKTMYTFLLGSAALLWFAGCTTLVEKTGKVIDGSAFAEKKTAVYRTDGMEIRAVHNKAGDQSVIITLEEFPAIQLRGSAPDETGTFNLTALDYLGGNTHGWNEFRLDLSGSGNLVLGDTAATVSVPDEIETVEITSGKIRRYDTRITGSDAVSSLRNRRERILALTEWMNERSGAAFSDDALEDDDAISEDALANDDASDNAAIEDDAVANTAESGETGVSPRTDGASFAADIPEIKNIGDFDGYWKPILFPEMVKKKKRPEGWQQEGDQWEKAEDIRWNTSYTGRVLPEVLWGIRNSGTLLRDWEEALEWIYVECEWGRIKEILAQETMLTRK